MSVENHPAYPEERARLDETLRQVKSQWRRLAGVSEIVVDEEDEDALHAVRAAQEALETMREDAVERLKTARREPYFGRLDFEEGRGEGPEVLYIGKSGIKEEGSDRPLVIDWRAPVSSLFYTTAGGGDETVAYRAPGGLVEGMLWLKRNLAVKHGVLQHIADAKVKGAPDEAGGGDTFLLYRLQESRDDKLRDIVSSIQQEQNAIIRAEADRPLIIQGVAGSGKTTVALHRMAYLLYTYRDTMDAERMIIFAPNRMFLDYIADVLPELGVGGIKQVTFQDWALDNIDEALQMADPGERLAQYFAPGIDPGEDPASPGRFKGSLYFQEVLDRALAHYEDTFVPEADLELWPGKRISYPQIYIWFHEQYHLYPLNTRKKRILSRLRTWAKSQVEPYMGTLAEKERRKAMATAVRHYTALWPNHSALTLYKEILGLGAPRGKRVAELGSPDIPDAVVRESRALFKQDVVAPEDLAPLLYLEERLHGRKETRELDHVVIDEAQDVTPFQLALLRRLTRSDSLTILGDLSQGIHTYTGIASWDEFMAVFPPGAVSYHVLEQSYRSTHEIMTFANQVLIRAGSHGPLAKPVFRAGEPVRLRQVDAAGHHEAIAAEVRRLQQQHASVAVVARTDHEAAAVHATLRAFGLDAERITADQRKYKGGLSVIPSYLTKGLEFDAVIVADASAENYGISKRDARLLYVVCTRALHDLTLLYTGAISPLLDAIPGDLYQK